MKKIVTALILLSVCIYSSGQTVSYDDFKSLVPYLKAEDWRSAFSESSKLLKSAEEDTSDFKAIVLYINIFSAAGMVTERKMSYKELEKNIMKFKGQKIIMSAHPVARSGANTISQTSFSSTDSTNEAFTSATNSRGTNILCFERFFFKEKINPGDFQNSFVRCGGTLKKIEINPNKSLIWILRLTITDAFARKAN